MKTRVRGGASDTESSVQVLKGETSPAVEVHVDECIQSEGFGRVAFEAGLDDLWSRPEGDPYA